LPPIFHGLALPLQGGTVVGSWESRREGELLTAQEKEARLHHSREPDAICGVVVKDFSADNVRLE
jgi:hypothetical protein